jgi:hypothetical protein
MSATVLSQQSYGTITRPSIATDVAEKFAHKLLRWAERHSRVTQLSHEEMALLLANDRAVAEVHEGRNW